MDTAFMGLTSSAVSRSTESYQPDDQPFNPFPAT